MGYHQESMTGSNVWKSKDTFPRLQTHNFYIFNGTNLQPPPKLRVVMLIGGYMMAMMPWTFPLYIFQAPVASLQPKDMSNRYLKPRSSWYRDPKSEMKSEMTRGLRDGTCVLNIGKTLSFLKGNSWNKNLLIWGVAYFWIVQLKCFTRFLKQLIVVQQIFYKPSYRWWWNLRMKTPANQRRMRPNKPLCFLLVC